MPPSREAVYARFLAGDIDVQQALVELSALGPGWIEYFPDWQLTPEQLARLGELGAAIGAQWWEEIKKRNPLFPDVAYGSKEFHDFWRTPPDWVDDLDE